MIDFQRNRYGQPEQDEMECTCVMDAEASFTLKTCLCPGVGVKITDHRAPRPDKAWCRIQVTLVISVMFGSQSSV